MATPALTLSHKGGGKPISGIEWDAFVRGHKGHAFQAQGWGDLAASLGWTPHFLPAEGLDDRAQALVLERRRMGAAMHYCPRGPVADPKDKMAWEMALQGLEDLSGARGALVCRINPHASRDNGLGSLFERRGWVPAASREMHVRTFRLDTTQSEQELWDGLAYRTRKAIKKAQGHGITCAKESGSQALEAFLKLYEGNARRRNIPMHDPAFVRRVWQSWEQEGRVHIFVARDKGSAVSALFLFQYGDTMEEMWIGWDDAATAARPNQALHWEILRWCHANGIRAYDFGGVPPEADPTKGVAFYKSGFGAQQVDLTGEYDYFPSAWGKWVWTTLRPMLRR